MHELASQGRPRGGHGVKTAGQRPTPPKAGEALSRRDLLGRGLATAAGSALPAPLFAENRRVDVTVVGAGLAGLMAAHTLRGYGLSVQLLEASGRVGGRVRSLRRLPGSPEAGATEIGASYHLLRATSKDLGLRFEPLRYVSDYAYSVRGQLFAADAWPASPANALRGDQRDQPPSRLLLRYILAEIRRREASPWHAPGNRDLDRPLAEFLRAQGADHEAVRLMGHNLNGASVDSLSALDVYRRFARFVGGSGARPVAERLVGGNQTLAWSLADSLAGHIRLHQPVTEIVARNDELVLRCRGAAEWRSRRCVVAAPFSALRRVSLRAPISAAKRRWIANLAYTPVVVVMLAPRRAFWEQDGLPASMWTDTPIGRVFAEQDSSGAVLRLKVFVMGPPAMQLSTLSDAEIARLVIAELARARPRSRGQVVLEQVVNWVGDPNYGGVFEHFNAGQLNDLATDVDALARPERLLHFAGSHTALPHPGAEAAVQSGLRAAQEVHAALSR